MIRGERRSISAIFHLLITGKVRMDVFHAITMANQSSDSLCFKYLLDEEKVALLKSAMMFVFSSSFRRGFKLPVREGHTVRELGAHAKYPHCRGR